MNLCKEMVETSDRLAKLSLVKNKRSFSSAVVQQPNPNKKLKQQPQNPNKQQLNIIQQWDQNLKQLQQQSETVVRPNPSPSSKKLTRIRYQFRKLIQQWRLLLQEEEEKRGNFQNWGNETGEAVSVEKSEDGSFLILFNCPCKCSFQLLRSGNDYYYKLCEKKSSLF